MSKLSAIKNLIDSSVGGIEHSDGVIDIHLPFTKDVYNYAMICSEQNIISSTFDFSFKGVERTRSFCLWSSLPLALQEGKTPSFKVNMNLKSLRMDNVHVYFDEKELIELCPLAPERFLIIALKLNENKCTLCPDDYNKNEILRYKHIRKIWDLLCSCSDYQNGIELVYLFKQKITLSLNYSINDLEFDFDGFARLEKIFSDGLHIEEKRHIMQNTLYSFLWRTKSNECFKKLLSDFTLFAMNFEENYRSFSVGFSFDKIRKEYSERFRDYLSKLNGIMYDTLTRSLSIPVTGLISFIAMKGDFDESNALINIGAILLTLFSTISIHYLVTFQINMVSISRLEYTELFSSIRNELDSLDLKELSFKEGMLNSQANKIMSILRFVYTIAICNLIVNAIMFIITTF